jgi:hypothetical protein
MGVGRFQSGKREDEHYATQSDPAPKPARPELSPVDDTQQPQNLRMLEI